MIRISPRTEENDFRLKMKKVKGFLEEGRAVRVFVVFKRGHGRFQEEAEKGLKRAMEVVEEFGTVERKGGGVEEEEEEEEVVVGEKRKKRRKPLEFLVRPRKGKKKKEGNGNGNSNGNEDLKREVGGNVG